MQLDVDLKVYRVLNIIIMDIDVLINVEKFKINKWLKLNVTYFKNFDFKLYNLNTKY